MVIHKVIHSLWITLKKPTPEVVVRPTWVRPGPCNEMYDPGINIF